MQVHELGNREWRLHEWQSALQGCILDPRRDRYPIRPRLQAGSVDADSQLDIYANAYVMRLAEALRSNYPAVQRALGDEDFDLMARGYLELYPSVHASIRWLGDSLATFLQDREPYCRVPVLSELASFEWAIRHTLDAADADRLTVESLLSVPEQQWGDLRFDLHPSVTRLSLQWNAPQLWHALTDSASTSAEESIEQPVRQPGHWLIYRKPDLVSGWRSLSDSEAAALDVLQQGGTFADICECVAEQGVGDAAMQAAGLLRLWVEQGILARREPPVHESMID
jgi:hypothetical protein